jgi:hypothetical protein
MDLQILKIMEYGYYLGAGYCSGNATIGACRARDENNIYGSAFMPFVLVLF